MRFIRFLATTLALLSSIATAEVISGNLDLCIPSSNNISSTKCLDSLNGTLKPSFRSSNDNNNTEEHAFNWRYDNGLLGAVAHGASLCLGPTASTLSTKAYKPYELILKECPSSEHDDNASDNLEDEKDISWFLAKTRDMRFLITPEGRVQSLAAVINPETGMDETSTHPYCLTMMTEEGGTDEKAYLVPCEDEEADNYIKNGFDDKPPSETTEHKTALPGAVAKYQVFDIYGTYSRSFLIPLRRVWFDKEAVELAFQVGLPLRPNEGSDISNASFSSATAVSIEINILTTHWTVNGVNHQSGGQMGMDIIPLKESLTSGILSLTPFDLSQDGFGYQLGVTMTATLRTSKKEDSGDFLVLNEASFVVTTTVGSIGKKPSNLYTTFILLLGCVVTCFLLSALAEKLCLNKTRSTTSGDGNNDEKTVCMSMEEEDEDFPLENDVEVGVGMIIIQKESSREDLSDTDLEQEEQDFPKADDGKESNV